MTDDNAKQITQVRAPLPDGPTRITTLLKELADAVRGLEYHIFIRDEADFDNMRTVSSWFREYQPRQSGETTRAK
jgi:hypothetical protein